MFTSSLQRSSLPLTYSSGQLRPLTTLRSPLSGATEAVADSALSSSGASLATRSPLSPRMHAPSSPAFFRQMSSSSSVSHALPEGAIAGLATSTPASSTFATLTAMLPSWAVILPIALVAATGFIGLAAWVDARLKARIPSLQMAQTPFNRAVLARCPTIFETYQPLPFLTNGHVETIVASFVRSRPSVPYRREFLQMSDGGLVTLDWEHVSDPEQDLPADAPVLILLPGLTGGSGCSYVLHAVKRARQQGIRAVVFNSRGTADSPVTTPQFYSASFTGDMREVVKYVQRCRPSSLLLAAGWSLGANIMMRYLGEEGQATPIKAAVSMCNPFNLTISNANFEKGFNKVYDQNLADALQKIFAKHDKVFRGAKGSVRPDLVPLAKTVRDFDDAITIHTFGWPSVDQYYAGSSSSLSVPHISIPLLCVQALDDPIAPKEAIPYAALEANANCVLVCTPTGGHLGWVSGPGGFGGEPWTDQVAMEWFQSVMMEMKAGSSSGGDASGSSSSSEELELELAVPEGMQAAPGSSAGFSAVAMPLQCSAGQSLDPVFERAASAASSLCTPTVVSAAGSGAAVALAMPSTPPRTSVEQPHVQGLKMEFAMQAAAAAQAAAMPSQGMLTHVDRASCPSDEIASAVQINGVHAAAGQPMAAEPAASPATAFQRIFGSSLFGLRTQQQQETQAGSSSQPERTGSPDPATALQYESLRFGF